jgi:glycosyltransferase involved in cell wall biosynthesis
MRAFPQIVEFPNIEAERLATMSQDNCGTRRLARRLEAVKSRWWEPTVARTATMSISLCDRDTMTIRRWGGRVLQVPNGVDRHTYVKSPIDGYALAIASYDYEPNIAAVRHFVGTVWPLVLIQIPTARLVIAGRASEQLRDDVRSVQGVSVWGELDDVGSAYGGAAAAIAPAHSGGGSQLKITEAVSRGREVVVSTFSAEGLPSTIRGCGSIHVASGPNDFADALAATLTNPEMRHVRERAGWEHCRALSWSETTAVLAQYIGGLSARAAG